MGSTARAALVLAPGEGRAYPMGRISALFKADGAETAGGYSISEWWLEPHTQGPGAHSHPEDDVFYVLAPAGMTHDFENRGPVRAGLLNFSAPGDFERHMPGIVEWFTTNPSSKAGA